MNPMIIAGLAALAFMALAGVQTSRLASAQEENGELRAKLEVQATETRQAVNANASLNVEIDTLAGRIADLVEARRLEREEHDRVLAAREEDLADALAQARRLEGERDEIFRNDAQCEQLGSTRIDTVCPAIAEQLRGLTARRARGGDSEDGGGAGGDSPPSADAADHAVALSPATG